MRFFQAIQVHIEEKPRRRFELVQAFADEHSIRAQIDVFLAGNNLADEAAQVGIDHRLTAANGDDGSATLIQSVETLFDG